MAVNRIVATPAALISAPVMKDMPSISAEGCATVSNNAASNKVHVHNLIIYIRISCDVKVFLL